MIINLFNKANNRSICFNLRYFVQKVGYTKSAENKHIQISRLCYKNKSLSVQWVVSGPLQPLPRITPAERGESNEPQSKHY